MAYLAPHFDFDAFVSYSQGDPRRMGDSPLKQWTTSFISKLMSEITSVDTEFDQLQIWHDEQIDPTADLTAGLREKVKSSAILLIIMSPRYLKSQWCTSELDWFRQQIQDRSRDQGRVFVVRQLPTSESEWPDFLRDERGNAPVGFRFHDPQNSMPYGWRGVGESDKEYVSELWRLQTALTRRLRELKQRMDIRAAPAAVATSAPAGGGRVYLHARAADASVSGDVQRRLKELGVNPMSMVGGAGPELADRICESKARFELARRCDALTLVRPDADDKCVGDLIDIGVDERRRIELARGAPLPCAVFDRSGADLPIDVSPFGIKRFDLSQANWGIQFTAWLNDARAHRPGAA